MKTVNFKRILLCMMVIPFIFASCSDDYNDEEIWEKVNELEERIEALETSTSQINSNISSLQTLINALQNNLYITSTSEMANKAGYNIRLSNGTTIPVYHGTNGSTPTIGVIKQSDGEYYWTVNGELLKDSDGKSIRANGNDGSNPPAPELKTGNKLKEDEIKPADGDDDWQPDAVYLSVDGGKTWTKISVDNESPIFSSVDVVEDVNGNYAEYVEFTLSDGTSFSIFCRDETEVALYGTWEGEDKDGNYILLTFSENRNYWYVVGSNRISGKFEYFPSRYMFVLYDFEVSPGIEENPLYTVVKIVTEEELYITKNNEGDLIILSWVE